MMRGTEFLPVSREEMIERGWYYYDFLVVTADAYIDHPSFGTTLIARALEFCIILGYYIFIVTKCAEKSYKYRKYKEQKSRNYYSYS